MIYERVTDATVLRRGKLGFYARCTFMQFIQRLKVGFLLWTLSLDENAGKIYIIRFEIHWKVTFQSNYYYSSECAEILNLNRILKKPKRFDKKNLN